MARIMDALKGMEPPTVSREEMASESNQASAPIKIHNGEEEFPFIEVGAAEGAIEASPDVLQQPVKKQPESEPHLVLMENEEPVGTVSPGGVDYRALRSPFPGGGAVDGLAAELLVYHNPQHPISKQYLQLGLQMLEGDHAPQTMLFTSFNSGAGVTTALLNLAIGIATNHRLKVAVVDLNWKCPALAAYLDLTVSPGIQEVLAGKVALEQAIQATSIPRLFGLTAFPGTTETLALWTSDALRWMVNRLRDRFDVIFLDGPVWETTAELSSLAATVDVVYPVLEEKDAESEQFQRVIRAISRKGGRVRGLIRTHVRAA